MVGREPSVLGEKQAAFLPAWERRDELIRRRELDVDLQRFFERGSRLLRPFQMVEALSYPLSTG